MTLNLDTSTHCRIAHLGPSGTYAEAAAVAYTQHHRLSGHGDYQLIPYPSIAQALHAVAKGTAELAVVPVENSIEGGVTVTLDTVWQLDGVQIQSALVLPISHALLSYAPTLADIRTIMSHPQALAQCQEWLERFLPAVQVVPCNSTTEAIQHLDANPTIGTIASQRAAKLYNVPILVHPINDYPDNCTRFWVVGLEPSPGGSHTSLAFSFSSNRPGSLVKALHIFAERNINLSRVESRPTKRSLGDYLFFIDLEADLRDESVQSAIAQLADHAETLKVLGSYTVIVV